MKVLLQLCYCPLLLCGLCGNHISIFIFNVDNYILYSVCLCSRAGTRPAPTLLGLFLRRQGAIMRPYILSDIFNFFKIFMRLPQIFPFQIDKELKTKYNNEIIYGDVAQLARACGSYPQCRVFESHRRYQLENREKRLKSSLFFINLIKQKALLC